MLNTKKITTYIFISSLSVFSMFLTSNNIDQIENKKLLKKNNTAVSLFIDDCDCSCFQAFLLEENKEIKKLINCYKNQIPIFK